MILKTRLFVDQPVGLNQSFELNSDQSHYLLSVLRLSDGNLIGTFDGHNGEWAAELQQISKKRVSITCKEKVRAQRNPPDLWLCFAPIKKARTDFIVEKATELGIGTIIPVQTDFTNSERIKQDRLKAHAREAAEQCGGTYVPEVTAMHKLSDLLKTWPEDRFLLFCDEDQVGTQVDFDALPRGKWAILIGPEGGFSKAERTRLNNMPQAHSVSLGPRILRADTAAVTALTLWHHRLGDW